jgi:tRNA pseudouridine65 synthase
MLHLLQLATIIPLLVALETISALGNIKPQHHRKEHSNPTLGLYPNDVQSAESNSTAAPADNSTNNVIKHKRQRIPILSYKHNHVIVSKPAGVSMHRNSIQWGHAAKSPSLEKLIHKQLARKPYLVHRLDHRTSGAVLMGFDSQTAGKLHGRMRQERAVKLYVALVRGDLREIFESADVCAAGERLEDILPSGKEMMTVEPTLPLARGKVYGKITIDMPIQVDEGEKEAKTDFYFLSSIDLNKSTISSVETDNEMRFVNKALTLLLCRPRTGRTHQIRRHLRKGLNSPIVGDSEHGDSRVNRFWRETIGLDRLSLHCWYLRLPPSPDDNNDEQAVENDGDSTMECIAPLLDDFTMALNHKDLTDLWYEALQLEPLLGLEPYDEREGSHGRHYRLKIEQS